MLRLNHIGFKDFRSYRSFDLSCERDTCVIVGPNAVGKTNVIEGVQLVTGIDSFRTAHWADLPTWGHACAGIHALIEGDGRSIELDMTVEDGKRSYALNGKKKRPSQLRGILPVVLFTPDDLRLIKDDAQKRRLALDTTGIQLSPTYASLRADYDKAVRQRNKLLKEDRIDVSLIDSWTESLVLIGSRFYRHRRHLFELLRDKFKSTYGYLASGEAADIRYQPSWERDQSAPGQPLPVLSSDAELNEVRERYLTALRAARGREYERRTTLVGPHRDEVLFLIDGQDARKFASQGQQRTLALAWKLAEVAVIEEIGGQTPVLLLDDVMSELDGSRKKALTEYANARIQTFITSTSTEGFDEALLKKSQVVRLEKRDVR